MGNKVLTQEMWEQFNWFIEERDRLEAAYRTKGISKEARLIYFAELQKIHRAFKQFYQKFTTPQVIELNSRIEEKEQETFLNKMHYILRYS